MQIYVTLSFVEERTNCELLEVIFVRIKFHPLILTLEMFLIRIRVKYEHLSLYERFAIKGFVTKIYKVLRSNDRSSFEM